VPNFIKEKIEELRRRLLDLSNRNPLLSFTHSERALTHIRIIDELPDVLFGSLLDGKKLIFKPLPDPDDEPQDEKTDFFQTEFREATIMDEEYLKKIAELENQDDSFDRLAVIERGLKNRLRRRLGMVSVDDLTPLSNSQLARNFGLEPKYDMPVPNNDDCQPTRHHDEYIQTLLKQSELQHKLSGLRRYIISDMDETGVNTFYAAFGFLERYDSNNPEMPIFAPLVLLQLDAEKPLDKQNMADGEIVVSTHASGDVPQYNLPLAEKLREFDLNLPELAGDDTPESYMQKVERLIRNKNRWRVRRFITLGRFRFSRFEMYHDLNPERWPENGKIENNEVINSLFGGRERVGGPVDDHADVYDIDKDPEVEEFAPILIMDADSSQHSAIVDAMKGNNLVIKGPPGTGKSQTITNLIANALAKKKKVLFIAEKMAALNVVYHRLQSVGLDDFCLELHSTKSTLKHIKKGLARALENRTTAVPPPNLTRRVTEIKEAQKRLREYSDVLNKTIGNSGKTIHEFMWLEQNGRLLFKDMPVAIKSIPIRNALFYTEQNLESFCSELKRLESLEMENAIYSNGRHPWVGVSTTNASGLNAQEIVQAFEECGDVLDLILEDTKIFELRFQWTAKKTLTEWRKAGENCLKIWSCRDSQVNFNFLKYLKSPDTLVVAKDLLKTLGSYDQAITEVGEHVQTPMICINRFDEMSELCREAESLGIKDDTAPTIAERIKKQNGQIKQWEKNSDSLNRTAQKIFGTSEGELNRLNLNLLLKAINILSDIDKEVLFLRHEEGIKEANQPVITNALRQQKKTE